MAQEDVDGQQGGKAQAAPKRSRKTAPPSPERGAVDGAACSKGHEEFDLADAAGAEPARAKTRARAAATPARPRGGKGSAVSQLAERAQQLEQAELLRATKNRLRDQQLSLFDLAPWDDHMRAMPNDFARIALFTTRNKKVARAAYEAAPLFAVQKDVQVTFTGIELRAYDDELVWLQVLEYAKRVAIGAPITFTFYELCSDLGWPINGRYYKTAEACLSRLQANAMQFSSNRVGRLESLSLIHRFRVLDRGKKTSRCQVQIDEEIVVLFAGNHYSKFVWEKYRALSPTARRLFDNFASHREPFPLGVETFRLMCGSDSLRPNKWLEQSNKACDELNQSGLVKNTWITNGQIHCDR